VVFLARDLIGKVLCTNIKGSITKGIITETEAYNGVIDKACHAYKRRRTNRTETMYLEGGHAYIYLCYGIHHLFNIVTGLENDPTAVLIRGIQPLTGTDKIKLRRKNNQNLGVGPGVVSMALGITTDLNQTSLQSKSIWLEDHGYIYQDKEVEITPRIGVDYAEEDALLPFRFVFRN